MQGVNTMANNMENETYKFSYNDFRSDRIRCSISESSICKFLMSSINTLLKI